MANLKRVFHAALLTIALASGTNSVAQEGDTIAENERRYPTRTASGIVLDNESNPVSKAILCYRSMRDGKRINVIEKTNENGEFSITYQQHRRFDGFHTWVYAKGHGVRTVGMGAKFRKNGQGKTTNLENVEIHLPKDQPYEIKILDPDGSSLHDIKVHVSIGQIPNGKFESDVPTGLSGIVPVPFCRLLTSATDELGTAILKGIPANLASRIAVTSPEFGTQYLSIDPGNEYQLSKVGSVAGAINAKDVTPYIGMKIFMQSWSRNGGYSEAIVDSEGKFDVPAMAEGDLTIDIAWPEGAEIYPWIDSNTTVKAGEELRLDTASQPSRFVAVTGKIVTGDTRRPVTNATISFQDDRGRSGTSVDTNENGEYEAKVCEGSAKWQIISIGALHGNYDYPRPIQVAFNIPVGTKQLRLDPILLPTKPTVRGQLVDSNDVPIAEVNVVIYRGAYGHTLGSATTDLEGNFEMKVSNGWENAMKNERRNYFAIRTKTEKDKQLPNFERLDVVDKNPDSLQLKRLAPDPIEKPKDK